MKILVTSGATREPLDDVRFLSNVSTGATGAALADALAAHGHAVTLLRGTGATGPKAVREVITFSSTADLEAQLKLRLRTVRFDAVIHCAAVADYKPARVTRGKMSSYAPTLTLRLVPTPKLLPQLKSWAKPARGTSASVRPPLIIGFKLTSGADVAARSAAIARLFAAGTVDAAVHNDMTELSAGRTRPFRAYVAGHPRPEKLSGIPALARWLNRFLGAARL